MSLHHLIAAHREDLIRRARAKVAKRPSPQPAENELVHGVPFFLSQLVEVLEFQERAATQSGPNQAAGEDPDGVAAIGKTAELHGQDLRKRGFTIEQVVRDYGDVCQAVTELAFEEDLHLTTTEFHTLNRCLDDAIAGAVSSWSAADESSPANARSETFRQELQGQLEIAIAAFEALRAGRVGIGGATASVIGRCLGKMATLLQNLGKTN